MRNIYTLRYCAAIGLLSFCTLACGNEEDLARAESSVSGEPSSSSDSARGDSKEEVERIQELRAPVAAPDIPEGVELGLLERAYVVNRDSDNVIVIDLNSFEIIADIPTGGDTNHMAGLSTDFAEVVVDSSETNEAIIIDARLLELAGTINLGKHPAHITLAPNGLMAIMEEDDNAIVFIDPKKQEIVDRIGGEDSDAFSTPHFMRFDHAGKFGYVANISGYHLTRVNMETMKVDGRIELEGFGGVVPGQSVVESGFADAQIDSQGLLYAAHAETGRVLVYDTLELKVVDELEVGAQPWVVFAARHFEDKVRRHFVPVFGDRTLGLIDATLDTPTLTGFLEGDEEAYGVNFTSLAPDRAFVMNRVGENISVIDAFNGELVHKIDVGGNVETASTTRDGKYIVAAVSDANKVVILDTESEEIVKVFDDVGDYPWSVTIPLGQNYCH